MADTRTLAASSEARPSEDSIRLAANSRILPASIRRPNVHPSYIIPVLSKALSIMTLLRGSERPLTVQEIVDTTGIAKSTVYRILRTLSAHGYMPRGGVGLYGFNRALVDPQDVRTERR